jgi:hypothetical protein
MSCVVIIIGYDVSKPLLLDIARVRASGADVLGVCSSENCEKTQRLTVQSNAASPSGFSTALTADSAAKPSETYVLQFPTHEQAKAWLDTLDPATLAGKLVLLVDPSFGPPAVAAPPPPSAP